MRVYMIDKNKKRDYRERDINGTIEMFNKGHFVMVADVGYDGTPLEEVYTIMQNDQDNWINNPDIVTWARHSAYYRSLSIGDVILRGYGINKEYFVVSSFGFTKMEGVNEMFG